ncbi:MAG: 50S ribosomal protein L20 [Candidatus Omnitrophota bacterium]|jgi:large subunit ribosomal protein L20|nr:MAG: 50S ribosomal protein L20 [Candidatus Omnitrophota bacterium]
MPRAISQVASRRRRKKILKLAKGARLGRRNQIRAARHGVFKGLAYAYRDRRNRKREFRCLWITRIGAAAKMEGISYSEFIGGLSKAGVDINRKILSELAINDPAAFRDLVSIARNAFV